MSGLFKSKSKNISEVPLITPEQSQAMNILLNFAKTGSLPTGFQAGAPLNISNFDFDMTGAEGLGQNLLVKLLSGGEPEGLSTARNTLTGLANEKFNLDDPSNGFASFSRQLSRGIKDADDVLNREAAITGSRYGSRILGEKADLAAQQSDIISSRLSDLFNQSKNRSLNAALGLGNIENISEGINQGRVTSAFGLGGLERDLANQKAQLEYSELTRQRDEQLATLTGAESVFNKQIPYGITNYDVKSPSLFSQLLNPIIGSAGKAIGPTIGKAAASGLGTAASGIGSLLIKAATFL